MAWAFYIFQICIMRKWKIFAYFYTSEPYNSCVMFFWPVWGGSGSGGYLVVAKKALKSCYMRSQSLEGG